MPVGSFPANGYGLYDMAGNLCEWCWDWYDSSYYTTCDNLGTVTDPVGPTTGLSRVLRDGCWYGVAGHCKVAGRGADRPNSSEDFSGFRVARTP